MYRDFLDEMPSICFKTVSTLTKVSSSHFIIYEAVKFTTCKGRLKNSIHYGHKLFTVYSTKFYEEDPKQ